MNKDENYLIGFKGILSDDIDFEIDTFQTGKERKFSEAGKFSYFLGRFVYSAEFRRKFNSYLYEIEKHKDENDFNLTKLDSFIESLFE